MDKFTDGETVYFKVGPNGELWVVEPDPMGLDRGVLAKATIDHVDVEKKTIWFKSSLPKEVRR